MRPVFNKHVSVDMVFNLLHPLAASHKLCFAQFSTGPDFLQWSLPGNDWKSFVDCSTAEQAAVAGALSERKAQLEADLREKQFVEPIFTVPSDEFIYYRQSGKDLEIALTAWGHHYPDQPAGEALSAWLSQQEKEDVNIAFKWNDKLLPRFKFKLQGYERETSRDGYLHFDRTVLVGTVFSIKAPTGEHLELLVEKGKADYVYDLTQYFNVKITVTQDGEPIADAQVEVCYDKTIASLKTDAAGKIEHTLPIAIDADGTLNFITCPCEVSCAGQCISQTPTEADEVLSYHFDFNTPEPEPEPEPEPMPEPMPKPEPEPEPNPEPEFVTIKLKDYGGKPLGNMAFTLTTSDGGRSQYQTDSQGSCQVPKSLFSDRTKFKIEFIVSSEYQTAHDINSIAIDNTK